MSFDWSKSYKTIYISGPISGNRLFKEDFKRAEKYLKENVKDVNVLNPAEIPDPDIRSPNIWGYFMRNALRMLTNADTIFMLEGWQQSRGASLEHRVALDLGMEVWYENNYIPCQTTKKISEPFPPNDLEYYKASARLTGWEVSDINHDMRVITLMKREHPTKGDLLYD